MGRMEGKTGGGREGSRRRKGGAQCRMQTLQKFTMNRFWSGVVLEITQKTPKPFAPGVMGRICLSQRFFLENLKCCTMCNI